MMYKGKKHAIISLTAVTILFSIVTPGIGPSRASEQFSGICRLRSQDRPKTISVVLDNSSSMLREDYGNREYTTRWNDADYAIKALTAMMAENDIMRLYIASGYRKGANGTSSNPAVVTIASQKKENISQIENYLNQVKMSDWTYYQGVENAVREMKEESDEREKWLVILTDGAFNQPDRLDQESLQKNLEDITASGISVAYIPIGSDAVSIVEKPEKKLYVFENVSGEDSNGILTQVTNTINRIYGRVRLDETTKSRYLSEDDDGSKCMKIDIPVEKMIFFLQKKNIQPERVKSRNIVRENFEETLVKPDDFIMTDHVGFQSRVDVPEFEDTLNNIETGKIIAYDLQGAMFTYQTNTENAMWDSVREIRIDSGKKELTAEVYYQPAIGVQVQYEQDGNAVDHTEDCLKTQGQSTHIENCLHEGPVVLKLKLTDYNGNPLEHLDSGLLYEEKISLKLIPKDDPESEGIAVHQEGDRFRYEGNLEQKDYELIINTSWAVQSLGEIHVQERRKPLEIELVDTESIQLDASEKSPIYVRVKEDGESLKPNAESNMTVSCESRIPEIVISKGEKSKSGVWCFYASLADPSIHQISSLSDPELPLHFTASRAYEFGDPVIAEKDERVSLTSIKPRFCVETGENNKFSALHLLFRSEKAEYRYLCNDLELTEEQAEHVSITEFQIIPVEMQDLVVCEGKKGIELKRSLLWWNNNVPEVEVSFLAKYPMLVSESDPFLAVLKLEVIPVPSSLKWFLLLSIIFIVVWISLCVQKRFNGDFIQPFKVSLRSESSSVTYPVEVKRLCHICIPFCKEVKLVHKASSNKDHINIPTIKIKIVKYRMGDGYEIRNYLDFANEKIYQIGGYAITENNRVIGEWNQFTCRDRKDVLFVLHLEK